MRIAAFQMVARPGDVDANLAAMGDAAARAAAAGAELLVAPELATTGYGAAAAIRGAGADHADAIVAIARRAGIAVVAGYPEPVGGIRYNSAVFAGPDGVRHDYRKCQLYGPYERGLFAAGPTAPTTFTWRGLTIGLLICFDVEFPEMVRRLAADGADLVLVPTALPASDHAGFIAEKLVPVRAFENHLALIYADHAGSDERFAYAGLSAIVMPDGTDAARAGAEGMALLIADYDPLAYAETRAVNPYLAERRLTFGQDADSSRRSHSLKAR